jgi:hypothetical protein
MTFNRLKSKFKKHGIITDGMGDICDSRMKRLLEQINSGESLIVVIDGIAVRIVENVVVRVTREVNQTLEQKLVEVERREVSGKIIRCELLDGIGKKVQRGETPSLTAERCLRVKLGFKRLRSIRYVKSDEIISDDDSPLPSRILLTIRHFFHCKIPKRLYKLIYVRRYPGRHTATFRWLPVAKQLSREVQIL